MRVAQIAPLFESVPPEKYGGTERVVAYLTEALVEQGHDVTLFASGDSLTRAKLVSPCEKALRLHGGYSHSQIPHMLMFEQLRRMTHQFDILHFHTDHMHFPVLRNWSVPSVTTLHGRLDSPHITSLYREFKEFPLVSISNSQRRPIPWAHWKATVYHGLPPDLYQYKPGPGSYAAFLGRISPEKRPDRAIEIARRAGMPLKIAAKIDVADIDYYENRIRPMIEKSHDVEFIGEITDDEKNEFLGNAAVLLCPIDWPEPFGLVMIEALACGTPVIAFRNGSVPELIREGVNGFVVDTVGEAVEKMEVISSVNRRTCYNYFQRKFSNRAMAEAYVDLYKKVVEEHQTKRMIAPGVNLWRTSSISTIRSIS